MCVCVFHVCVLPRPHASSPFFSCHPLGFPDDRLGPRPARRHEVPGVDNAAVLVDFNGLVEGKIYRKPWLLP